MLHQFGVLFDLYYDARKHKSKIQVWICLHLQSRYFDCEYDQNDQEKTDGGLGAGTPMFISEVMHGTACSILWTLDNFSATLITARKTRQNALYMKPSCSVTYKHVNLLFLVYILVMVSDE